MSAAQGRTGIGATAGGQHLALSGALAVKHWQQSNCGYVPAIIKGVTMHELTGRTHWHEPTGSNRAGFGEFGRPKTPYDLFMESEGIPIYRDIGVSKVQNLPLAPWKRLGGKGSFIQLHGTEGKWGSYVVEVPGAGALNPEKHLYEEIYLVVEGRGTTEVWLDNDSKTPRVRMAEGLVVLDSGQCVAPHRQCKLGAGAAAGRHHGA